MEKKSIVEIFEIALRWCAYVSAIFTLVFAYIIYGQYNVTTSIKNNETEIVLDLLSSINSQPIYFKSWAKFELNSDRKPQYDNLIYETTLTSAKNVLSNEILDNNILMDIRFNKYLATLKEKYLNSPIPLNLKNALDSCISANQNYYPIIRFENENLIEMNLIGTKYPFVLTEKLISFSDNNSNLLTTKQYFDKWVKLHNTLLLWLTENSNIKPYKYYKKHPSFLSIRFDEKRTKPSSKFRKESE